MGTQVKQKIFTYLMCFLVVASASAFSGCATASHDVSTSQNNASGLEKRQPAATEGMNAFQKTGYYIGWYSLAFAYLCAGASVPLCPPSGY